MMVVTKKTLMPIDARVIAIISNDSFSGGGVIIIDLVSYKPFFFSSLSLFYSVGAIQHNQGQ